MAKVSNVGTRVYFDEFDISGVVNATELGLEQERSPVACFSDTGPRRVVGNYDHRGVHNGFFDGDEDGFDEQAFVDLDTDEDHYLCQCFGAATEGSIVYERVVRLSAQPRSGGGGGAILLNLEVEGSGDLSRALVLRSAAVSGIGNGTGRNQGATTAGQKYQVTFRVLAVSGVGSITLQAQESSDNASVDPYALITGLEATFTAVGVSRVTTTAATEAWKRVAVSALTGFTNVTILVTAGLVTGS